MKRLLLVLLLSVLSVFGDTGNGHLLIDFGITSNITTLTGWNNITNVAVGDTTTKFPLIDTIGVSTSVTLRFTTAPRGDPSCNTDGSTTSTLYPASATGDSMYTSTNSYNGTDSTLAFVLDNLNSTKTYKFKFYASRAGVADIRTAQYSVVGATSQIVVLDAANNVNNAIETDAIAPSGTSVIITMTKAASNNNSNGFAYVGVLEITEYASATTKVMRRVIQ